MTPATDVEGRRLEVVVIEDDAPLREVLIDTLREDGYVVRATDDGAEGLAWIEERPPHVVLLDMVMPHAVVDGFEFIARLRKSPREVRDVPLVLLSALGPVLSTAIDARTASALNIVSILAKPCNLAELLKAVRTAAQRRRRRSA